MDEGSASDDVDARLGQTTQTKKDHAMSAPAAQDSSQWGGVAFSREIQDRAWENGEMVPGNDAALWRKDEFGAWIHRLEFGNRHSDFGWEVLDRSDWPGVVVRPLQWQNYIDQVAAHTQSRVTATGLRNMRRLL